MARLVLSALLGILDRVARSFILPVALATLAVVVACPDHDVKLEDAISQYIAQREAESQAACECHELFLNPNDFTNSTFTSKEECLATFAQPPQEEVMNCMKSVLESEGLSAADSVDVVTCYTNEITEKADCYAQNAGECSQSACSSDVAEIDVCRGDLTPTAAETLYYCAVQ